MTIKRASNKLANNRTPHVFLALFSPFSSVVKRTLYEIPIIKPRNSGGSSVIPISYNGLPLSCKGFSVDNFAGFFSIIASISSQSISEHLKNTFRRDFISLKTIPVSSPSSYIAKTLTFDVFIFRLNLLSF